MLSIDTRTILETKNYESIDSYQKNSEEIEIFENTKEDRVQKLSEPLSHVTNKSILEKYCSSFCCTNRTKLTHDELHSFYKMKKISLVKINKESHEYDYLFRNLWTNLCSDYLDNIINMRWEYYGFQNKDPRSDIRGGGLVSLYHLIYFSDLFKSDVEKMIDPEYGFLFACSSINVSYFLINYYHLSENSQIKKNKKELASRKALKSFCTILEEDDEVLSKLHSVLLKDLFNIWGLIVKSKPNSTYLDFPEAFSVMKKRYHKGTKKLLTSKLEDIFASYNKTNK